MGRLAFQKAEPLSQSDAAEYPLSELHVVDGKTYLLDDLYRCNGCESLFVDHVLDHEGECEECAEKSRQAAEEDEDLRRWARWACR